jgi:integrase
MRRRLLVEESLAELSTGILFGPTKTHATRRVPLTAGLLKAIRDRLENVGPEPEALVFTTNGGGPIRHSNVFHRVWRPALDRAGLPAVGVHVLRHSAAAALIASGASPKAVQSILGHRSAAFTLTVYGHLFDADMDDIASRLEASIAERVRPGRGLAIIEGGAAEVQHGR